MCDLSFGIIKYYYNQFDYFTKFLKGHEILWGYK